MDIEELIAIGGYTREEAERVFADLNACEAEDETVELRFARTF